MSETKQSSAGTKVVISAAVVVIIAGLKLSSPILVPFLFALFLAIVLAPFIRLLSMIGVNEIVALLVVCFLFLVAGMILVRIAGSSVKTFTDNSTSYQERLDQRLEEFKSSLADKGIEVAEDFDIASLEADQVLSFAVYALANLNSIFKNGFLIFLTTLLLLIEWRSVRRKIDQLSTDENQLERRVGLIADNTRRYLVIKTVVSLATGLLVWIGLEILGIPFAALWGLISFLLNYVPTIGSLIAAVPAVLLALIEHGLASAVWTTILFVGINQALGTFIEPRLQGRGLGLSPFVVFVSLIFWGWVLGPVGMVLSAPLTMAVKIACQENPNTRWLAILLGQGAPVTADAK